MPHPLPPKPSSSSHLQSLNVNTPRNEPNVPSTDTPTTDSVAGKGFVLQEEYIPLGGVSDTESQENLPSVKVKIKENEGKKRADKKRKRDQVDDKPANGRKRAHWECPKAPWAVDVDWDRCNNVAEMLHKEVKAFVKYISPSLEEHHARTMTVEIISRAVVKAYPDAIVIPFGSFETKLYLPLGDIDLVIQSTSMMSYNKEQVLRSLANILRRAGIADRVTIIAKAKVPIVKFVTKIGRFPVDISINQINGVVAGKMVNRFLEEMPSLRSLVLVIKSFLSQRSMNEVFSGGLGSYSIVCLIISFLQMHPKIRRGEIEPSKNLGVLVMEFFELYGRYFNYNNTGISIRNGGTYYNKSHRGWYDSKKSHLLSIEDPGDIGNDISRGSYGIGNVKQTFAGAFEIMSAATFLRAQVINSRRRGEYVDLRGGQSQLHPEDMSILASVMGVTQETLNHRRALKSFYYKGEFHRMLGIRFTGHPAQSRPPLSRVRSPDPRTSTSKPVPRRAVNTGMEEREVIEVSSESEGEVSRTFKHLKQEIKSGDEEGRYDVGNPARKRRRLGREADAHTIYVSDDDGYHTLSVSEGEGNLKKEQRETSIRDGEKPVSLSQSSDKEERRRAYWASKGGLGLPDDVD